MNRWCHRSTLTRKFAGFLLTATSINILMRAKEFTVKLDEIKMSTASLRQLAANINALAGMEFEMR